MSSGKLLVTAHLTSLIGERLSYIALIVLASSMSGPVLGPTIVMVLYTITFFLAGPLAGPLVDRYSRKKLIIIADVLRSGIVLLYIPFSNTSTSPTSEFGFYALIFCTVFISTVARSAFWAVVPETISTNQLSKVNSTLAANDNISLATGTALGAWLLSQFSAPTIFVIDAFTYLFSLMCFLKIKTLKATADLPSSERSTTWSKLFFCEVLNSPLLLKTSIFACLIAVLSGMMNSYMSIGAIKRLHLPSEYVGYLYSLFAVGSIIAAVLVRKVSLDTPLALPITLGFGSICFVGSVSQNSFTWLCVAVVLFGTATTLIFTLSSTVGMRTCKTEYHGRFSSLFMMLTRLSLFIGLLSMPLLQANTLYLAVASSSIFVTGLALHFFKTETK